MLQLRRIHSARGSYPDHAVQKSLQQKEQAHQLQPIQISLPHTLFVFPAISLPTTDSGIRTHSREYHTIAHTPHKVRFLGTLEVLWVICVQMEQLNLALDSVIHVVASIRPLLEHKSFRKLIAFALTNISHLIGKFQTFFLLQHQLHQLNSQFHVSHHFQPLFHMEYGLL